jgi:hypothetical protein
MIQRITVTLVMRSDFEGSPHQATFSWEPTADDPLAGLLSAKNDELLSQQVLAAGPAVGTLET